MKKSELKASIKEEIIEILSEATPEEIEAQKELNAELEKTKELQDDLSEEYAADKFNVNVFGYQTKYYKVCPGAKSFMDKVVAGTYGDVDKEKAIRLAKLHDVLFLLELRSLKDPQYANDVIKVISIIYSWAIKKKGMKLINPVRDVAKFAERKVKEKLSAEDNNKILDHCEGKAFDYNPCFLALVALSLYLGKRVVELFGLRWKAATTKEELKEAVRL